MAEEKEVLSWFSLGALGVLGRLSPVEARQARRGCYFELRERVRSQSHEHGLGTFPYFFIRLGRKFVSSPSLSLVKIIRPKALY